MTRINLLVLISIAALLSLWLMGVFYMEIIDTSIHILPILAAALFVVKWK